MIRIRLVKQSDLPPGCGCLVVKIRIDDKREWREYGGVPEILTPPTVVGGEPTWQPVDFVIEPIAPLEGKIVA